MSVNQIRNLGTGPGFSKIPISNGDRAFKCFKRPKYGQNILYHLNNTIIMWA